MTSNVRPAHRAGHTLLELGAALTILAMTLVPGLRLMRDGMKVSRQLETRGMLSTLCVSKLEQKLAAMAATWQLTPENGTFATEGVPSVRFQLDVSDQPAAGGVVDVLAAVTCTVWEESTGNTTCEASELQLSLSTKIARISVYEDEAAL